MVKNFLVNFHHFFSTPSKILFSGFTVQNLSFQIVFNAQVIDESAECSFISVTFVFSSVRLDLFNPPENVKKQA